MRHLVSYSAFHPEQVHHDVVYLHNGEGVLVPVHGASSRFARRALARAI